MMDEYEENIKGMLKPLEDMVKSLDTCKPSEKEGIFRNIKAKSTEIESELDLFNAELAILDYAEQKEYKVVYQSLLQDFSRIKNALEMKKMDDGHLVDNIVDGVAMNPEEAQKKAIAHGDKLLAGSKERAQNILFMTKQANIMVADINDEIREQNQRMMDMEEIIKDSQSALNRANELVRYFARAFYRDIFLKILIVLIALAVIGITIASVANKKSTAVAANTTNNTTNNTVIKRRVRLLKESNIWDSKHFYELVPEAKGKVHPSELNNDRPSLVTYI